MVVSEESSDASLVQESASTTEVCNSNSPEIIIPADNVTVNAPLENIVMSAASQRPVKANTIPKKYKDFTRLPVTFVGSAQYPISLPYNVYSSEYKRFLTNVTVKPEPQTFYQASQHAGCV